MISGGKFFLSIGQKEGPVECCRVLLFVGRADL